MWHGLAAAQHAWKDYEIKDDSILNAIAWHTTGAKGLGEVGLTLFVADFVEPTRNYPHVKEIREEVIGQQTVEEAAMRVAELKIQNVRKKKQPTHNRTQEMFDWLSQQCPSPQP